MLVVILLVILALLGGALMVRRYRSRTGPARHATTLALAVVLILLAGTAALTSVYRQSPGEASVIVGLGGDVRGTSTQAGFGIKAPWQRRVVFSTKAQQLAYAGTNEGSPDYTRGNVDGQEITSSVKGGAVVNFDATVSYSLDASVIADVYSEYRTQESYTAMVVEQNVLDVLRTVPTRYEASEFRGDKNEDAQQAVTDEITTRLKDKGIVVRSALIQNIRYSDSVETRLQDAEAAKADKAKAEADLAAAKVRAEQKQVEADAQASANTTISQSLTPELIEQHRIEALSKAAENGNLVIAPDGTQPIIQPKNADK